MENGDLHHQLMWLEHSKEFSFNKLYLALKDEGFVIYPGKLTEIETFRIGTIGDVYKDDIERLVSCIGKLV